MTKHFVQIISIIKLLLMKQKSKPIKRFSKFTKNTIKLFLLNYKVYKQLIWKKFVQTSQIL